MRTEVLKLRLTRKAQWTCLGLAAAVGMGLIFQPTAAHALAGACVNCHTMHNSQNGIAMATDALGNPDLTANDQLLNGADCLACHTGINAAGTTPFVTSAGVPGAGTTLAGGTFYYPHTTGVTYGHNLSGLGAAVSADDNLAGGVSGFLPPGGDVADLPGKLTCAGTTGCHGVRATTGDMAAISGSHHNNVNGELYGTPATPAASYRFLDGIQGTEDTDYELTVSATDHNGYFGVGRGSDALASIDPTTISALCADCHGGFHNDGAVSTIPVANEGIEGTVWGSPWIRHPTDLDMNTAALKAKEYGAITDYSIVSPVATDAGVAGATLLTTAMMTTARPVVVMCISCHRAHGSEYPDALRWDYTLMTVNNAGVGAQTGCFYCHTAKDGI